MINKGLVAMQVYAIVNQPTDIPYWFTRDVFYDYFDQHDFMDRDIENVQFAYLREWFHTTEDGKQWFYIPVVSVAYGRTDLIGSRHRLAVLLPHLDELPIATATAFLTPEARQVLDSIPKRELDQRQPFWIPDLPIFEKLPCY
ncbi:MAG TPA: hypothetical protein PLY14_07020 [Deltaproteobacteria bacterium]|mgnify:FL=1|nr:hypothetical protein [Deltaproteobacteria bacterium]HPI26068.1 hypothetical protein [Candidatus Cloacimonadota bacterium]HNS89838.1 hypothetical protein [Deltaproteobacteria bacterium]HOA44734.1 hypothetical protein [Deltaproteobacteria bacterium]HOC75742.1 hypothetical protein [Deltaproteobacteria bacterium]